MILETPRLGLRRLTQEDFPALCRTLQDLVAMTAYEGAFSDGEVQAWLDRQLDRYAQYGNFGLWAVIERESGLFVGQCGLTLQSWEGAGVLEIGYLFQRDRWHRGYATEAARACKAYAFDTLGAAEASSLIRDANLPSQRVALRNEMTPRDTMVKHYRGVEMPHTRYAVSRTE